MASRFGWNPGWEKALKKAVQPQLQETARKMERVLAGFTNQYQGTAPADIKEPLRSAFKRHGWNLTDPELTRFATAVSEGEAIRVKPDLG